MNQTFSSTTVNNSIPHDLYHLKVDLKNGRHLLNDSKIALFYESEKIIQNQSKNANTVYFELKPVVESNNPTIAPLFIVAIFQIPDAYPQLNIKHRFELVYINKTIINHKEMMTEYSSIIDKNIIPVNVYNRIQSWWDVRSSRWTNIQFMWNEIVSNCNDIQKAQIAQIDKRSAKVS